MPPEGIMSFAEVFADLRRRRRIPMRLFRDRTGVSPSYIHDIEHGITIPSLEKLKAMTSVFREVAAEQGAADPDAEGSDLLRARELTLYVDRLEIDPRLARIFVALRELDEESLAEIEQPILEATELFRGLQQPTQRGVGRALLEAVSVVKALEHDERSQVGMEIATAVSDVVGPIKDRGYNDAPRPDVPKTPQARSALRELEHQHAVRPA
jgi:transcriptional regulator with XRE-family HTH domain